MPNEEEGADSLRDGLRKLRKPHWRAKLFSKDGKHEDDTEQSLTINDDVLDFLGSSPQKSQPHSDPPSKHGVPPPRIDVSVSQRWPGSHDISDLEPHNNSDQDAYSRGREEQPRRRRPRREGLRVTFTPDEPEIIGEGGDEAELPTSQLQGTRNRSHGPVPKLQGDSQLGVQPPGAREEPRFQSSKSQYQEDFEPRIFIRAPTGLSEPQIDGNVTEGTATLLNTDLAHRPRNTEDVSPSSAKCSFAARMRAKMRAEEGIVFNSGLRDPSPANEQARLRYDTSPRPDRPIPSPLPSQEHSEGSMSYSLRPTPVPAVQSRSKIPSQEQDYFHAAMPQAPSSLPPPYQQSAPREPEPTHSAAHWPSQDPNFKSTQTSLPEADPPHVPKGPSKSMRSAVVAISDDALGDFASRVDHYSSLFSLAAESAKPVMETSLAEWVRCSTWWFLKGRSELEAFIRSRPRETGEKGSHLSTHARPLQAFVDLSKALWINQHIVPQHPELKRYGNMSTTALIAIVESVGDRELVSHLELHQNIIANLRALTMSMKRNNILPLEQTGLPQGLDTSIWIKYPFFTPDISTMLSGTAARSMVVNGPRKSIDVASILPFGDTAQQFCYSRMLVNVWLTSEDDKSQPFDLPCLLSVLRNRNDWAVMVRIGSQNELVNILLQGDRNQGPTWEDVQWSARSHAIRIRMPRGFELNVQFKEQDFKSLWNIVDYTRKTMMSLQPEASEALIFENITSTFQYVEGSANKSFPPEPSKRCRIKVFERTATRNEGFGRQRFHRGFRLIAVTSPKVKTLSSVSHILGNGAPILFSYLRGDDGAPALMIKIREGGVKRSMILTFHEPGERAALHAMLIGSALEEDETETQALPLSSFSMESQKGQIDDSAPRMDPLKHLPWQSVRIVDRKLQTPIHDPTQRNASSSLRICMESSSGTITDRVNIGPGELQLSLSLNDQTSLRVLRSAQEDLTMCIIENIVSKELAGALVDLLKMIATSSTIRTYKFTSLQDLHVFQQALTGFVVLFDGVATSFAISRRRMVVPIYKRWEANLVRLQALKQDKILQLVAFFSDFVHGECMNFNVKSTDVFESFNRSGKFCVRLVDAKFALPKVEEDETKAFVSLDLPEYPGEHDDITMAFETESDRERFQAILPASVKEASRINALRK